MDLFDDPRVLAAEARHSRRRRRAGAVFDFLSSLFHFALLFLAVALILRFAQIILREGFGM